MWSCEAPFVFKLEWSGGKKSYRIQSNHCFYTFESSNNQKAEATNSFPKSKSMLRYLCVIQSSFLLPFLHLSSCILEM